MKPHATGLTTGHTSREEVGEGSGFGEGISGGKVPKVSKGSRESKVGQRLRQAGLESSSKQRTAAEGESGIGAHPLVKDVKRDGETLP
jgi:hypothetical protein